MSHDDDLEEAERLDDAWDAVVRRQGVDNVDDDEFASTLRRFFLLAATPDPRPGFLAALRQRLVSRRRVTPARASGAHVGLVAAHATTATRPAYGRNALLAAMIAIVLGVAIVGWPAEDSDVPLVASALASSEASGIVAVPTTTAALTAARLRTVDASVSVWEAPAIGTPTAALAPSTPVELLAETVGREGERWLHVRAGDGATGWIRARDVLAGDR